MFREDLTEYNRLYSILRELYQKYEEQKNRISMLLEQAAYTRRRLEMELGKAKSLTRRLSELQRKQLGLLYDPGKYPQNGSMQTGFFPNDPSQSGFSRNGLLVPGLEPPPLPVFFQDYSNRKELKTAEIKIISMIDAIKKKLLGLELLELRLGELLVSIGKAMQAYNQQWRRIRRCIYPLGIISVLFKWIRQILGGSHFSAKDIKEIAFLGNLAGNITKMANSLAY